MHTKSKTKTKPPQIIESTLNNRLSTSLYAKHLGVSAKLIIYISLICVAVEQKRTRVNLLPVINMLVTFEQLFSFGFIQFLAISTSRPYSPILTSEGSKID